MKNEIVKKRDGYSLTPHISKLKTVHPSPDRPSLHTSANSTHISEYYSIAACLALITNNQLPIGNVGKLLSQGNLQHELWLGSNPQLDHESDELTTVSRCLIIKNTTK